MNCKPVGPFTRLAGLRVVFVDDCDDARDMFAFLLRRHGADVTAVDCARKAFDLVVATLPDVLVSDVAMPVEDGYALLRRIRALPGLPGLTPAIALTAFADPRDRRTAFDAGFDFHLAKTVPIETVVAAILRLVLERVAELEQIAPPSKSSA